MIARLCPARIRSWTLYGGAVLAVALLFSAQTVAYWVTADKGFHWIKAVYWNLSQFAIWGALAPGVYRVAAHLPVDGDDWPRNLPLHLILATVAHVIHSGVFLGANELLGLGLRVSESVGQAYTSLLARHALPNLLTYTVIVAARQVMDLRRVARDRQLRTSRLEAKLANARLQALRAQLNPHFLFNALGAVSEFTHEDPDRADRMIGHLSDLLRASLDGGRQQEVPLEREIRVLEPYLEVERARFEDRLRVDVQLSPSCRSALVPSFLLQPLVENAIRHGASRAREFGRVLVRAERRDGILQITVQDNGPGPEGPATARSPGRELDGEGASATIGETESGGIGLASTRARLRELYGEKGEFRLREAPGGGTLVEVEIPFRRAVSRSDSG